MFPKINFFWLFDIYIFWLTIVFCFFAFLWMLKKFSIRFWYDYKFFINSILWYFLSTFFFSRLFYVIANWKDMQHIDNPFSFFIMSDYYFSLYWAIFWFLLVLLFNIKLFKKDIRPYIDWVVLSFLFVAILGYIWALFGGQVYWKITDYWIEIPYTSSSISVDLSWELFPLPIIYALFSFLLFVVLDILSMYIKVRGLLWYLWLGIFSALVLVFDFLSGKTDMFKISYWLNFSQILAIIFIIYSFYWIFQIIKKWEKKPKETLINN